MNQEIKKIKFGEDELLGVKTEDGQVWLGVRKVCLDIGLTPKQAQRQVANIQEDLVLSKGYSNLGILTEGGKQEVIAIKEDFVTLWLAKISLTPVMQKKSPVAVQKLVNYQLKAQKVLHEAFTATEEDKQEFYSNIGLDGKIEELKVEMIELKSEMKTLSSYVTINAHQSQKLLELVKNRVNLLLGGAKSDLYKQLSRVYFKNLWTQLGNEFGVPTYKDLNPVNVNDAVNFIKAWDYVN